MLLEITMRYAGLLGMMMAALSIRVPLRRAALRAPWGDADDAILATRIRVFGNFIEYVPMILLLMALVEVSNGAPVVLHVAGVSTLFARAIHALSLHREKSEIWRKIARGMGAMGTWIVLVFLSVYAVYLGVIV